MRKEINNVWDGRFRIDVLRINEVLGLMSYVVATIVKLKMFTVV